MIYFIVIIIIGQLQLDCVIKFACPDVAVMVAWALKSLVCLCMFVYNNYVKLVCG